MNERFLVPANSKRGLLIFGIFYISDLILFLIGLAVTFVLLLTFGVDNIIGGILVMLPLLITALLVFPMPNYHNVRTFVGEMINYYTGIRKFIWKGWCYSSESESKAQWATKK